MEPPKKWIERGEALAVEITGRDCPPSSATVYRQTLDKPARIVRALKGLALCWLLAGLCVFIPGFHLVLVPMFLLLGPILFALRVREEDLILGGILVCPACGKTSRIGASAEEWPLGTSCGPCGKQLELQPATESAGEETTAAS